MKKRLVRTPHDPHASDTQGAEIIGRCGQIFLISVFRMYAVYVCVC